MAGHPEVMPSDSQRQNPESIEGSTNHLTQLTVPIDATKNVKNLSLNTSAVVLPRPATATGLETSHAFSAPTSPLKDAPRTGRRKPTNLTIRTPGFQQLSFSRALDVPPTPSSRPSLHHMQSSPALAALASPAKPPPAQGLFLHLPAQATFQSGSGSESSSSGHSANSALPELREEDEFRPQRSQETQEKGYPKGPVLIYDSGVYLYLEPTAEEASNFDTVINVAKEIKTPFEDSIVQQAASEPQTAISELSFKSAWEWPKTDEAPTPTTPKPGLFNQKKPEYLHIPWDHNSEILEDLYSLCRIIDDRVQAGKKVLIHCQLGVSRSASLVIAYGLYKGYQPDFHSMYMSVKQRSQWVGPNMSLIYQLTDFRSKVVKGIYSERSHDPPSTWWKLQASPSPVMETPIARRPVWQQVAPQRETPGAALETGKPDAASEMKDGVRLRFHKILPPVPLFPKDDQADTLATPVKLKGILGGIAQQDTKQEAQPELTSTTESTSPPPSVSPRPLPFRERFDIPTTNQPTQVSSRHAKLGVLTSSPRMDLAMYDEPETPSLFSPRAAEFMASPFGITSAGDLAVPSTKPRPAKGLLVPQHIMDLPSDSTADQIPIGFDPRSPHQQGEGPEILRNIDDFL